MILVDTSVWIGLLRDDRTPAVEVLRRALLTEDTGVTPVIVQEILAGARGTADLATLRTHFLDLPCLKATLETHARAGELYARCRWAGITPRSPHDCLIAAVALEHRVPLLADDRDFEQIARVEPGLRLIVV